MRAVNATCKPDTNGYLALTAASETTAETQAVVGIACAIAGDRSSAFLHSDKDPRGAKSSCFSHTFILRLIRQGLTLLGPESPFAVLHALGKPP